MATVEHVFPVTIPSNQVFRVPLAHLGNVKQKKGESLKSYLNHFTKKSTYVRWIPDVGILAHLTNGLLTETPFWDELQQKECRSVSEFYRKVNKFLKLEHSKDALHKTQGTSTSKKNDPGEAAKNNKGNEKRKGDEKRTKSPKKQRNGSIENKAPLPKYTNYHSLTALVDHIYAVTDNNLYRSPDTMKGNKSQRDVKKNCTFHKDNEHSTKRCVALKNEIERLIRVRPVKEFLDEP